VNKIEHLGIAVANLEEAEARWTQLLGVSPYRREEVPTEGVRTAFFQVGPNKIELLEAMHDESPIAKFIAKRGEGIHHTAFSVSDIKLEMSRLQEQGYRLLSDAPRPGAENMWVCFLHPKEANGVLVELCQPRD
jgi:methylmalonyl-CoA/ethylmalonyl-CoA epimerase